jgi:hypothetical protein
MYRAIIAAAVSVSTQKLATQRSSCRGEAKKCMTDTTGGGGGVQAYDVAVESPPDQGGAINELEFADVIL